MFQDENVENQTTDEPIASMSEEKKSSTPNVTSDRAVG